MIFISFEKMNYIKGSILSVKIVNKWIIVGFKGSTYLKNQTNYNNVIRKDVWLFDRKTICIIMFY